MSKQSTRKVRGVFEKVPGSGVWWICYFFRGKRHRERVGSKSLAIAAYQQRKTEIRQCKFTPPYLRSISLAELLERYSAHFAGLRSSAQHLRHRRKWEAYFGDQLAQDIKPGDIKAYVRKELARLAPGTVNREIAYLSKVFSLALEDELVQRNPCASVKKNRENNGRVRWLEPEEEGLLRQHFKPADWEVIELAILTGLRRGELFAIRREHVDFKRGLLHIPLRKHGESDDLPLTDRALAILIARLGRHGHTHVFPSRKAGVAMSGANWYRRVFVPAIQASGLRDVVFHTLRHTFCSRLVMSGVSLPVVQRLAGHKTIEMTNRYAHLQPEFKRAEINKLDGWRPPSPADYLPAFLTVSRALRGNGWWSVFWM